jgi:hypothetical protein
MQGLLGEILLQRRLSNANALYMNGNILEPYGLGCELEKKRIECAIAIRAVLSV